MARTSHFIALVAAGFLSTGCVSMEKYNALKLKADGLSEQLAKSQSDSSSAHAEADSYKSQLAALMNGGTNRDGLIANLTRDNADLQAQLKELNQRYADAMGKIGTGPALPEALDSALRGFAAQNPDLIEFDSARGVVKFKSDVTFGVGDAAVTAKAKEAITRFATILNSEAAGKYDLMVAGHTDNQAVRNPATISAGHKDNWYLSSHRAISVGNELQKERVSSQRIGVVGYADQRPVASNASSSGQAQNRRVEVLILPTQSRTNVVSTPAARTTARKPEANKDTGSAEMPTGPVMNK